MKDFQESTYGDRIAEVYDDIYGGLSSPERVDPVVDVLSELAGGRSSPGAGDRHRPDRVAPGRTRC